MSAPEKRRKRPDECPDCAGQGYTRATATEWEVDEAGANYRTTKQGSGCPRCGGIGVIEVPA